MYYLLRKQIILLVLTVIFCTLKSFGQREIYRTYHDDLSYYFGITLGYNSSFLQATKSSKFLQDDSVLSAEPGANSGIAMGLHATVNLSKRFQLRFNPQLILGGSRYFTYTLNINKYPSLGNQAEVKEILPTTLLSFPIHIKFNSDRIDNFRTYILAGVKYDIDLASNSSARKSDDMIRLKGGDYGVETGIGFNFFLQYVTISPEIKFSYGLADIHQRNPALMFSNVFDKIQSRMIIFSLHFED